MINMDSIIRQLASSAEGMHALVQSIPDEQAQWKPDPETWCMKEVMEHVYNEERLDFRQHLKEMLNDPPQPWGAFRHEEYIKVQSCRQALESFLTERQASIAWLKTLQSPDWGITTEVHYGSAGESFKLSVGDVLVSWVDHDYLHLRQMNELLHAWNEKQASPFSVQYAGGW